MSPTFDRLLYTDCRAGQGLGGGGGLQVQAQSAGVARSQADMAVEHLTYSIQTPWRTRGLSPEDWPWSLAHSTQDGFGTGQSRYLGAGLHDVRGGNQLADCLLTRDATGYGSIRPAQLWRSAVWSMEIRPSTDYPPLEDTLEEGPIDAAAVAAWLRRDGRRGELLQRLLTVLEDPTGPKAQLRGATTESTILWIVAATILLPMAEALQVTFRVFSGTRSQPGYRILGFPADVFPVFQPGSRPKTFLLDDVELVADAVEVSPRARFWVDLLQEAEDEDDVVEAVDLAARLAAGATSLDDEDARLTAWGILTGTVDPAALVRWIEAASPEVIADHAGPVVQLLLDSERATAAHLAAVDRVVSAGRGDVDRAELRLRLIAAEVRDALAGVSSAQLVSPARLTAEQNERARRAITSAMVAADDTTVGCLLGVVGRYGIRMSPAAPAYTDRLEAFVAAWLEAPSRFDPSPWGDLGESLVVDVLTAQLGQLAQTDPGRYSFVVRQLAGILSPYLTDTSHRLTWDVEACVTAALRDNARQSRLRDVVAGRAVASDSLDVRRRLSDYQTALLDWRSLDGDAEGVLTLVAVLPSAIDLALPFLEAAQLLVEKRSSKPDAILLAAIGALANRRALPKSPVAAALAKDLRKVEAVLNRVASAHSRDDLADLQTLVSRGAPAPESVWRAYASRLQPAAASASHPRAGTYLLRALPASVAEQFLRDWGAFLERDETGKALRFASAWLADKELPNARSQELTEVVVTWLRTLDADARKRIVGLAAPQETDYWMPAWYQLMESLAEPGKRSWLPGKKRR
ncbi:MAG TPA: hypothetical protein VGD15_02910 [Kribbella sp.]